MSRCDLCGKQYSGDDGGTEAHFAACHPTPKPTPERPSPQRLESLRSELTREWGRDKANDLFNEIDALTEAAAEALSYLLGLDNSNDEHTEAIGQLVRALRPT